MNAFNEAAREGLIDRFLRNTGLAGRVRPQIYENPTEEIEHAFNRGRGLRLFGAGPQGRRRDVRVEENYLYSTRRFPNNTTDNTIGAGAVAAQEYDFFGNGIGDVGSSMGYFSVGNLTALQTNMEKGGKIPKGKGYALFELGVSFNAEAIGSNMNQLLDVCTLKFEKGGGTSFTIQHGPIQLWPAGVGPSGFAATTVAATSLQGASNGLPHLGAARRFRSARKLSANESFKYVVTAAANRPNVNAAVALTAFVEMRIWLFGYHMDRIAE